MEISDCLAACAADIASLILFDILCTAAENAGRLIFFEYDTILIHINLKCRIFINIQHTAQFNRKHNASQSIDRTNHSC